MWTTGACILSLRFQVALNPVRLVMFLGLTCMAGHEKVKCEQYGPLGDQSGGCRVTCVAMTVEFVNLHFCQI